MATCDVPALLSSGACFCGATVSPVKLAELSLLCGIARALDPMAVCDLPTLLEQGKCFCKVTKNPFEIAKLQLLCNIRAGITGEISGVTGVNCGDGPPVGAPVSVCTLYYDNLTGTIWEWNGVAWIKANAGTNQIVAYVNDPNAELVVPGDQTKAAIAVSPGKTTFTWSTVNLDWE